MIIAANGAFAQKIGAIYPSKPIANQAFYNPKPVFLQHSLSSVLPSNFYCTQLGFFCKKELKIEAATGIPFKFRLGSLQYNDWMEGKKNAGILPAY